METIIEEAIEFAKEQSKGIVESGEEHQPIMLALTPGGGCIIQMAQMNKDRFKQDIAAVLRQLGAYACIFINEAWAAKLSKDSPLVPKLLRGEIKVTDLPPDDKEEILAITVAENGKSYYGWSAKILYTTDDKRLLGKWEELKGDAEGRLILKEW